MLRGFCAHVAVIPVGQRREIVKAARHLHRTALRRHQRNVHSVPAAVVRKPAKRVRHIARVRAGPPERELRRHGPPAVPDAQPVALLSQLRHRHRQLLRRAPAQVRLRVIIYRLAREVLRRRVPQIRIQPRQQPAHRHHVLRPRLRRRLNSRLGGGGGRRPGRFRPAGRENERNGERGGDSPAAHTPNSSFAFRLVAAAASSALMPRTCASFSTIYRSLPESLRSPRKGTGVR